MKNKVYMIYDTKNNECCVAQFDTRKEVAEYFKTSANYIGSAMSRNHKVEGRYLIERVSL